MANDRWTVAEGVWLDDAVQSNAKAPATFEIPPESVRKSLSRGDFVKLVFHFPAPIVYKGHSLSSERLWVEVTGVTSRAGEPEVPTYTGELRSHPFHDEPVKYGDTVRFQPHHVCAHDRPPEGWKP